MGISEQVEGHLGRKSTTNTYYVLGAWDLDANKMAPVDLISVKDRR